MKSNFFFGVNRDVNQMSVRIQITHSSLKFHGICAKREFIQLMKFEFQQIENLCVIRAVVFVCF